MRKGFLWRTIPLTAIYLQTSFHFNPSTMLNVFELHVKNPIFAQQKISPMQRVFFEELVYTCMFLKCIDLLDNLASEWANTDFMLELCSVLNINIKKLTFARHDTNTNASLNYEDLLENQNLWGLFSKIIYSIVRKITSSEWL